MTPIYYCGQAVMATGLVPSPHRYPMSFFHPHRFFSFPSTSPAPPLSYFRPGVTCMYVTCHMSRVTWRASFFIANRVQHLLPSSSTRIEWRMHGACTYTCCARLVLIVIMCNKQKKRLFWGASISRNRLFSHEVRLRTTINTTVAHRRDPSRFASCTCLSNPTMPVGGVFRPCVCSRHFSDQKQDVCML